MGKVTGQEQVRREKTSAVRPDKLRQGLKFAPLKERTDVSALLGRLTEQHLDARREGRR